LVFEKHKKAVTLLNKLLLLVLLPLKAKVLA